MHEAIQRCTLPFPAHPLHPLRHRAFRFTLKKKGGVIDAWNMAFATMKKGEKAVITATAPYAYGERGSPPKIPGGATLKFDVELLDFRPRELEMWEMSQQQKLDKAKELKAKGTEEYKAKAYVDAAEHYKEARDYLANIGDDAAAEDTMGEESAEEIRTLGYVSLSSFLRVVVREHRERMSCSNCLHTNAQLTRTHARTHTHTHMHAFFRLLPTTTASR